MRGVSATAAGRGCGQIRPGFQAARFSGRLLDFSGKQSQIAGELLTYSQL